MKSKKWIAIVVTLLCVLQIVVAQAAEAEAHHRFLLRKGVELTETLQKMAASEGYMSLFFSGTPDVKELAEEIAIGEFGKPDAAVIIELPEVSLELLLELLTASLINEDSSIDLSLFDDTTVKDMLIMRIPSIIPNLWLSRQGYAWMMLSNAITVSEMDDLPEGLGDYTYAALVYPEKQVVCLILFSPNNRWGFVSCFAQFMPYDSSLSMETMQEMINAEFPGWGNRVLSSFRIITFTGEEITDLLSE